MSLRSRAHPWFRSAQFVADDLAERFRARGISAARAASHLERAVGRRPRQIPARPHDPVPWQSIYRARGPRDRDEPAVQSFITRSAMEEFVREIRRHATGRVPSPHFRAWGSAVDEPNNKHGYVCGACGAYLRQGWDWTECPGAWPAPTARENRVPGMATSPNLRDDVDPEGPGQSRLPAKPRGQVDLSEVPDDALALELGRRADKRRTPGRITGSSIRRASSAGRSRCQRSGGKPPTMK